jgi:hypothetical protein
MSTGAFVGAVQENLTNDETSTVNKTVIVSEAGETDERIVDPNKYTQTEDESKKLDEISQDIDNVDFAAEPSAEYLVEIPSETSSDGGDTELEVDQQTITKPSGEEVYLNVEDELTSTLDDPDNEIITGTSKNLFSNAMSYILPPTQESDESIIDSIVESNSRAPSSLKTIILATDNPTQGGAGNGYLYKYGTTYRIYDTYYMYTYESNYYEYRGFSAFDLSDLTDYEGITVKSGAILFRNYQRNYALTTDFYTLNGIPQDGDTGSTAQKFFDEAGGTNSINLASYSSSIATDTTRKDNYFTISSDGIKDINDHLSSSNFGFSIGSDISVRSTTSSYARWYMYDVRLVLNFTFTSAPDTVDEVAVGDQLSGYVTSSIKYDYGRMYTSSTSSRAFAVWDTNNIKQLIPEKDSEGEPVTIKKVALRANSPYGYLQTLGVYHMKADPRTGSANSIYTDARDGSRYVYFPSTTSSELQEFEWDLGPQALTDFNNSFTDGNPSFFSLGFSRTTSYLYLYSPKLVVYYKVSDPKTQTINFGPDNPKNSGDAHGYIYSRKTSTSTTYYSYSQYQSYFRYYTSGSYTYENRGFTVYDLTQLNQWSGAKVTDAYLLARNYRRSYVNDIELYAMKTTPYNSAPSSTAKTLFDEAGGTGTTKIATFSDTTHSDSTYKDIMMPLNSNGITELNNLLSTSSTTLAFQVGGKITKMPVSSTSGTVYWRDIRLVITFEFSKEPIPTTSSNVGIAHGDVLSGRVYKYTSPTDYAEGRLYLTKYTTSENRGYAQWDISDIQAGMPKNIIITNVKLAINKDYGSALADIYHMKNNVTTATATEIFNDCADGVKYYSSLGSSSSDVEYEIDLGAQATKDFNDAFEDDSPDFFGVGFKVSTSYAYFYGPRLVLSWKFQPRTVKADPGGPYIGDENIPIMFNASKSLNLTKGTGALKYSWDWNFDGVFDEVTTNPFTNHTWDDDYTGTVTLKVDDTDTNTWAMENVSVTVLNVAPVIDSSSGSLSPQPVLEANEVKFSGFRFDDPGKDTWWYFWDFNGDGIFDSDGSTQGNRVVPDETWFYEDDFMGDAILVVVDDDGGTSNVTFKRKITANPPSRGTGYVYYYGSKYTSNYVYVYWQYTRDYQRGWAKFDISKIPDEARITKVEFTGRVLYNRSVNRAGIHVLTNDPTTSSGTTVYNEAGSGTRLTGINWDYGDKRANLGTAGVDMVQNGLTKDWVGLGFDLESPTTFGSYYGYMYGYSSYPMGLEIEYELMTPGCFVPVMVKNIPPTIDPTNITLSPTIIDEGQNITVEGVSFFDPGNDTYEYNISIGSYWTGWLPLGGMKAPTSSSDNIASDATPSSSGGGSGSYGPTSLNDLNENNMCWVSTSTGGSPTAYFQLSWSKKHLIGKMKVIQHGAWSNPGNRNLAGCDVQYWDGSKWVTDGTLSGLNANFEYTFKAARLTDRIRMTNLKVTGSQASNPCVYEWYVYPATSTGGGSWGVYGPGHHNVNVSLNMTIPDDHPLSGTSWDQLTVTVFVRDDDHNRFIPGKGLGPLEDSAVVDFDGTSSSSLAYTNSRKVIVDKDYNLYVIYTKRESSTTWYYQVFVAKSKDNGQTWTSTKVSNQWYFKDRYQYSPSLTIDNNGVLHAVWYGQTQDSSYNNIRYANSKDGGNTWGGHYNISSYTYYSSSMNPSLAVDADNTVHVSWSGRESSTYINNIYYTNRSALGSWSTATRLTSHTYGYPYLYQYGPSMDIDSSGNVHIAWYGYPSASYYPYYNIQYRVHWAGNDTWSNLNLLTADTSYYKYYPSLAVDENDDVHVLFYGNDVERTGSYNIMYMMYDSSTDSWGSREYLTDARSQYAGSIGFNKKGELDAIWYGYKLPTVTSPYIIHHAEKTGTTWTDDYNFINSPSYQYYPNLLCSKPFSISDEGFAFVWVDYSTVRFWTSDDFKIGNPEYTNGLAWYDMTVRVNNVAPKVNDSLLKGITVFEQTEFDMLILFEDPGLTAPTEIFEYKISWGDGKVTDWTASPAKTVDELLAGRNPETGFAYGTTIEDIYSFNEQPITYMWASFYSADSDTYDITINGFNKNTMAWEEIYSYYGFSSPGEFEQSFTTPIYTSWEIKFTDYENNDNIYYTYKFEVEDFSLSGLGYVTANHLYVDDMPTNTPEDQYRVEIQLRDDDLGSDMVSIDITVKNIAPVVKSGVVTPDITFGIEEGTPVQLQYFTFDDVAFEELTETFEYEIDWGDGSETSGWLSDFQMSGLGGDIYTVSPNVATSAATNYNNGRKIVMDKTGRLYSVLSHRESSSSFYYQIFVAVSDDYGETWTEYEVTTDSMFNNQYQYYPSIAMGSDGVLHVIWQGRTTTNTRDSVIYANSTDGGITWGNFTVIQNGVYYYSYPVYFYEYQYDPVLAIDSNDIVHIAWRYYNYSYNYATRVRKYQYAIRYANNEGGVWSTPIDVIYNWSSSSPLYFYRPSIATDKSDNVHIVWYGYTQWSRTYNIFYRKLESFTNTWDDILLLTNATGGYYYQSEAPSITTDLTGNVHVVWMQRNQAWWSYRPNIRYQMFDASTNSWSTIENITTSSSYYQYYPTIGVDQRGWVYIAWYGNSPYSINLRVKPAGDVFQAPIDITADSSFSSQYYPNIIGHGPNSYPERGAGVVWTGYRSGIYDTMFYGTEDFFLGFGPLKGIPTFEHLYRDDNPTATERDMYEIRIKVRDDDTGVGELNIPFEIRNVMPTIESDITLLRGNESRLILPAVEFSDPGTNDPLIVSEETSLFFEGFETGDFTAGPWTSGSGWAVSVDNQRSGTFYVEASGDYVDSTLTLNKDLDLSDYENLKMVFWQYTYYVEFNDEFYVDVSTDSGSTWTNVESWIGSDIEDNSEVYHQFELDLSAFDTSPTLRIRFRFTMSSGAEWWSMDDIEIKGDPIITSVATELWHFWWDLDNDGAKNGPDVSGTVTDITVIDNVSYCRLPEIVATYNDDHIGEAKLFIYDDDTPASWQFKGPLYLPGYRVIEANFEAYMWANVWESIDWSNIGYPSGPTTYCKDMSVYQNLGSWNEYTVNWTNYAPSTSNLNYVPEDTLTLAERKSLGVGDAYPSGGSSHWEVFDITDLTNDWLEGTANNYGLSIMPTMVNNTMVAWEHSTYYSSGSPLYVSSAYKPKLTIEVDTDNNGLPDTNYVLQPSDGKDAWIAQCSLNSSIMIENGNDTNLLTNSYSSSIGYSSIGSFFRRGLVEFDLSSVTWRSENSVIWEDPSFNMTVDVIVDNENPKLFDRMPRYFIPGDFIEFDIIISDAGSDDLNYTYDFGDGTAPIIGGQFFNDGTGPDATESPFNGIAPLELKPKISYIYYSPGTYLVNFSIWDDDGGHTNATIEIKVFSAKELKEEAIILLEPLVPGRWDYVGYQNLTLKFLGAKDPTVLAYNYISRPPYYWEMKLIYTFCDVDPGESIFVDASGLPAGMFGDKLILKTYDDCGLIDETEIPTTYSCLKKLNVSQVYGAWEIMAIGPKNGTTYHHYSKFALEVEDALDSILFSINKDPRRGYGWWHSSWVWYCGYWLERKLWIDDSRVDPQYGTIVFCEERNAVLNLMSVINNALQCDGVHNLTMRWTGKQLVDIEVYTYGVWYSWWSKWQHTHTFKGIAPDDEFFIGSRGYPLCGKLGKRTLIKVHRNSTGELLDAQYMRTSGFWPLEVEPGNMYGNLEIMNATLKLGCGNFEFWEAFTTHWFWQNWHWRPWYGDSSAWDDLDWAVSRSGCGWLEEKCWDEDVAANEAARITSNLSVIKTVIQILVLADKLLARQAFWDAENLTANVSGNQDEYEYHIKMAKRYMLRGNREAGKGRPHRAIRDYKLSWKNSILAAKWIIKNYEDTNVTSDPGEEEKCADWDCECYCLTGCGSKGVKSPWWFWWYLKFQWRYMREFAYFPDWREYTDPEVWDKGD